MEISILIVDDDRLLVEKLEKTMQWEKIGITMVFTAFHIRQAQKLLKEFSIQILLCDIDMPLGSGLELLEWVRDQKLEVECIFLSSYASFSYAQKAIKLATREYILKPASNRELENALTEIVQELMESKKAALPGLEENKEEFWRNFLCSSLTGEQLLEQTLKDGIYPEDDRILLAAVKVFEDERNSYNHNLFQIGVMIKNISLELLKKQGQNLETVVEAGHGEWVLVLHILEEPEDLEARLTELKKSLDKAIDLESFMYIARVRSIREAEISWNRIRLMEELIPPEANGMMKEIDLPKEPFLQPAEYVSPHWEFWKKRMGRPEDINRVGIDICGYLRDLSGKNKLTTANLECFFQELEQFIYDDLGEKGIPFLQLFSGKEFALKKRQAHYGMDYVTAFIMWIFDILAGSSLYEDEEDAIEHIKKYIEIHLHEDLSRNILAREVYLSEDYVSKMFKSTVGMSIPNYIAMKRMEKARDYLNNSTLSVSKIAQKVGYSNFSYFSKTFRDFAGMTPGEYRSRLDKNSQ